MTRPAVILQLLRDSEVAGHLKYFPSTVSDPPYFSVGVEEKFRRQGIATELLDMALRLWPEVDLDKQHYSADGLAWITAYKKRGA